jgi:hypothetical protein
LLNAPKTASDIRLESRIAKIALELDSVTRNYESELTRMGGWINKAEYDWPDYLQLILARDAIFHTAKKYRSYKPAALAYAEMNVRVWLADEQFVKITEFQADDILYRLARAGKSRLEPDLGQPWYRPWLKHDSQHWWWHRMPLQSDVSLAWLLESLPNLWGKAKH